MATKIWSFLTCGDLQKMTKINLPWNGQDSVKCLWVKISRQSNMGAGLVNICMDLLIRKK